MTRPHIKSYAWEPMTMTQAEVAEVVFRRSVSWFVAHVPADFPPPSADFGLFATAAVRAWIAKHFSIADKENPIKDGENDLLRRIANGKVQHTPSRQKEAR